MWRLNFQLGAAFKFFTEQLSLVIRTLDAIVSCVSCPPFADGHRMVLKSSEPLFGLGEGEFSATGYLRIVGRTAHTASELSDAEPGKKAGVGDLFKQINASVKDQLQEQVVAGPSQVSTNL